MKTEPRPRRWIALLGLALGLTSVLLLVVVDRLSDRWSSRDLNLLHALADIQGSVTSVHLWMTDLPHGDRGGDSGTDEAKLWNGLEQARALSRATLEGAPAGEFGRSPITPPSDPEIRRGLQEVRELLERFVLLTELRHRTAAEGRTAAKGRTAAGTAGGDLAADAEYAAAFAALDQRLSELQQRFGREIRANKRNSRYAIIAILITWLLIIVLCSAALWIYEERHARAQAALREREGQLLQSQKMEAVGRLAGGIAHDINNYLAAIRGQSELVKMKADPGDATARRMDMVLATADRASALIERLLAFSRRRPVETRTVDLNRVVEDLEPILERLIGDDIRLRMHPSPRPCLLDVDPAQMEQVIVNLLVNARQAMPTGGEVHLATGCRRIADDDAKETSMLPPGDYVELAVRDTGPGIPPEIRDKIFEPFFTTKADASGLGLPTVYGIVQQHGGDVVVTSTPGEGTTFRLLLPRADAGAPGAAEGSPVPSRDDRGAPVPQGLGERLLLVDDHEEFRRSMRELLEGLGYRVETAGEGAAALERFAAGGVDLVITDVVMPGLDGRELVDRLRRDHGAVKAIFVSGYTGDVVLRHGVNGELVTLLQKPFSVEELARAVRALLDRPDGAADDRRAAAGP